MIDIYSISAPLQLPHLGLSLFILICSHLPLHFIIVLYCRCKIYSMLANYTYNSSISMPTTKHPHHIDHPATLRLLSLQ